MEETEETEETATVKVMMLIEGMKRLKVIEKRMESNMASITRYSSGIDTEKEAFGDEEGQKKEVAKFIQSNGDLMEEYMRIKLQIDMTNLQTRVVLEGTERCLTEWLILKRKMARMMENTFGSLNEQTGTMKLRDQRRIGAEDKVPMLKRYYDEDKKNASMRKWQDTYNAIDSRLEVINATTTLVALPNQS